MDPRNQESRCSTTLESCQMRGIGASRNPSVRLALEGGLGSDIAFERVDEGPRRSIIVCTKLWFLSLRSGTKLSHKHCKHHQSQSTKTLLLTGVQIACTREIGRILICSHRLRGIP